MTGPARIRDLLVQAQQQLNDSDSARLDAEILLAFVMRVPRETFYAHPEDMVAADQICDYLSLVSRRASGYPVAYLTGQKEFWSTELTVNQHTLIPRPETECLVETSLELIPEQAGLDILDLGTGSGAIAIAIAKERPGSQVTAVDVVAESLTVAQANASRQRLSNIRFLQSDWFSDLPHAVFDIIVCNPPYVDARYRGFTDGDIRFEPRIALDGGHLGLTIINHLVPASIRHLKPGGYLLLEHGYDQAPSIQHLFKLNNYRNIRTRCDYAGQERVSYACLS